MPYNPSVNDNSGQILANHQVQGAYTRMQGKIALGEGIEEAGQAIGGGLSMGLGKVQGNAAKANTNAGTAEALDQIYGTYGTPQQRQEFLTGLEKVSGNQDKTAGYIAQHQQTGQALVQMAATNNQYDRAYNLAKQKAALGGGGGASNPALSVEVADDVDIWQD